MVVMAVAAKIVKMAILETLEILLLLLLLLLLRKRIKLKLNKFHQIDSKEKKRGITNKIRDLKRLIDHVKDKVVPADKNQEQIVEAKQKDLKELNKQKRDFRKKNFVEQKYKNIKMYGTRV